MSGSFFQAQTTASDGEWVNAVCPYA